MRAISQLEHERSILLAALQRAQQTRQFALARVELQRLEPVEWRHFEPLLDEHERWMYWSDDRADQHFLALGEALTQEACGEDRFTAIENTVAKWSQHLVGEAAGPSASAVPFVLAGFSFAVGEQGRTQPAQTQSWQGWPEARCFIPQTLVCAVEGHFSVVVYLVVRPSDTLEALTARLEGQLGRLPLTSGTLAGDQKGTSTVRWSSAGQADWQAKTEQARKDIERGELQKVVLARSACGQTPSGGTLNAFATALQLRKQQRCCTCFAWSEGGRGVFVGATPEVLVRVLDGRLQTVALAGTARSGQPLERSTKDRHEQELVRTMISQALAEVADDVSVAQEPEVIELSDVCHLETRFSATLLPSASIFSALRVLHPTPAVGGWPTAAAAAWREQYEQLQRGWYAAPLGWLDSRGNGTFVVAIRSALLRGDQAVAFAGCGLVQGSVCEEEWQESVLKLQPIRRALEVQWQP